MTDPQRFLDRIWAKQPAGRYRFLSTKDWDTGTWKDYALDNGAGLDDLVDETDLYFAPVLFKQPRRLRDHACPSRWLYADLDEVDPATLDIEPTLAWETSPGRFQAMWLLDRPLDKANFEHLNQRMTYFTGADKGGWSLTKVLRVPGSISTKYGRSRAKRFQVALVSKSGAYRIKDLQEAIPQLPEDRRTSILKLFGPNDTLPERDVVLRSWQSKLPMRAKKLLRSQGALEEGADRSARLWELYNLLLQAGMAPPEVLVAVQGTSWNKYAGQRRELEQLQREIAKAAEQHAVPSEMDRLVGTLRQRTPRAKGAVGRRLEKRKRENPGSLPYLTNSEFLRQNFPDPEWLVEGIWSKNAYGIWAGEFKAYKTVTLLDFAVSVASGVPFLGRFNVRDPGGVLYLHEEGQRGLIRDRLHRIEVNKGLAAKVTHNGNPTEATIEIPTDLEHLHISSFPGFKLTDPKGQEQLIRYIAEHRPRAVILETWYLIAGDVDENSAKEVAPALEFITQVSHDFETAILLSHHFNKGSDQPQGGHKRRRGTRVSGSNVFGRWYESAVYMERVGEEDTYTARIAAEHREQKGVGHLDLQFEMDVEDEDNYTVTVIDKAESTVSVGDVEVTPGAARGPRAAVRAGARGAGSGRGGVRQAAGRVRRGSGGQGA